MTHSKMTLFATLYAYGFAKYEELILYHRAAFTETVFKGIGKVYSIYHNGAY